jgi:outer membrane protein insertion porin family
MAQSSDTVLDIIVDGTQRIEPGTVISYLLIQKGDPFDAGRIDRSLKSLFATGLFADVALRREGDTLVISVVENPVINRIAFEGNKEIGDESLDAEVSLRPRIIYTRTKVQNDVKRISDLYRSQGHFAATVEPKVIQLPQNRIDLVFEIVEGEETFVRKIRFVGNNKFSDSRLREIIRTREDRWYRFFSSDNTFDVDRMTLDRELLRRFYLSNGHADFRVTSAIAELTPDRKDFFITFTVEEGVRYQFGDITVDARLRNIDEKEIIDTVEIEKGDWYDAGELEKDIDRLTHTVGTFGYAFIDIRPRINRDREARTVSVTFEINEGPRVFVERINIMGNMATADKVIRREIRLVEGDAFNTSKLRRSRQRIQNLDFFDKVSVEQVPGSAPDKAVVNVEVIEKPTGDVSLGVGFSSGNGALVDFGINERNLLGQGQDLSLKGRIATRQSQINLSFTEPYFLDRDVAAGIDVFHIREDMQDDSSFDSETTGGALRGGYPITERLRQNWKYMAKNTKVTDVAAGASQLIKDVGGDSSLSQVSLTTSYDSRDSVITPTEGYHVRVENDFAGLGGDKRHFRNTVTAAKYFTLVDGWILSFDGKAGYIAGIGKDVHLTERYFMGGEDLRGFATSGVGPRDNLTDDALGGEWMYAGSTELTFPLGLPVEFALAGKIFSDFGSTGQLEPSRTFVNDTGSIRVTVGAGVTWMSPFGPLGIDLGFPVAKESFDETETVRVNFGTSF